MRSLPAFLHVLTAIHALGAIACIIMATGSALSAGFRESLAVSGGSRLMLDLFGARTWVFLLFIAAVLTILAYGSFRVRPWAWHMTLAVYGIGVAGSLWQVSLGIRAAWVSAVVNGAVVAYASRDSVRVAYTGSGAPGREGSR